MKTRNRAKNITTAICLVIIMTGAIFSSGFAQSGAPGLCTDDVNSPCGAPVEHITEMIGNSTIHDSCVPEGACPWIQGVDIWWPDEATASQRPTNLLSVMNGTVVTACHLDTYANKVIAIKNAYYLAYYLHADSCLVSVGQEVKIGDPVGIMGNTGRSSLPHVHFALKFNDRGLSLRLEELLPLLTGWSKVSGTDPAPVSNFGSQPAQLSLDDLPYAMANQVVFTIPYTPTPASMPATPEQPTQILVVQPTQAPLPLPEASSNSNKDLLWVALVLLGLAYVFAPKDRGRRDRKE